MDRIEKLFRRLKARDRERLAHILEKLLAGDTTGLDIKKISGSNSFRVRSGSFRIIYHREGDAYVIDDVALRNERTYKGY